MNSMKKFFYDVIFSGIQSANNTIGIISKNDESYEDSYFFVRNCSFLNNTLMAKSSIYPGTNIYLFNERNSYIIDSQFSYNFYYNHQISSSGVCLTSLSTQNTSIIINNTKFFGNKGYTSANCIYFNGQSFSSFFSLFSNNTPADTLPLGQTPGYGGCMSVLAHQIFIKFNEFLNNIKGNGGCLSFYFPSTPSYESLVMVSDCWFFNNQALFSAGVYVHSMSMITFFIQNSFFCSNFAKQNGAALNMEGNIQTIFIVKSNLFFDNLSSHAVIMMNVNTLTNICFLCSNFIIENFGSDALPNQKSQINIYNYFPPGDGAGSIGFTSMTKIDVLVSLNDTFLKNFAYETAAVTSGLGNIYFFNCLIKDQSTCGFGQIIIVSELRVAFVNSRFENLFTNRKFASAIFLSDYVFLHINNSTFKNCSSLYGGIVETNGENNISIFNSYFEDVISKRGSFLLLTSNFDSYVILENNTLRIESELPTNIIRLYDISYFSSKNLTIYSKSQSFLWAQFSGIYFQDLVISNLLCIYGEDECFGHLENTSITISSSIFMNWTSYCANNLLYGINSQITLVNSSFSNLKAFYYTSVMYFENSNLYFRNTSFFNYTKGLVESLNCGIEIFDSSFSNENNYNLLTQSVNDVFSTLNMVSNEVTICNSTFEQNYNEFSDGGAFYLSDGNFFISQCTFLENMAINGGAIYIKENEGVFYQNTFIDNQAISSGGALYLESLGKIIIYQHIYINNSAVEGGALFYLESRPIIFESEYFNNSASEYGADFGSYPVNFQILDLESEMFNDLGSAYVRPDSEINTINTLRLGFYDFDDQLVRRSFENDFLTLNPYINPSQKTNYLNLKGTIKACIEGGVLEFTNIKLFLEPLNSTSQIDFTVDLSSIITNPSLSNSSDSSSYESIINGSTMFLIRMNLTACYQGEIYDDIVKSCTQCTNGSYSFNPLDLSCNICPLEALSCSENILDLKPGFWRSNKTANILGCTPYSMSCLGGNDSLCDIGYIGPTCQACDYIGGVKYVKKGQQCLVCAGEANLIIEFLLSCCLIAFLLVFSIYGNLKTSVLDNKNARMQNGLQKILITNLQLLPFLRFMDFTWDDKMLSFFEVQSYFSDISTQITSFDCFFSENNKKYALLVKSSFMSSLPFLLILLNMLFWKVKNRNQQKKNSQALLSTFIIIDIVLPSIINAMIESITCIEIDGVYYLRKDPSIVCYTEDHIFQAFIFAIPSLVFWAFLYQIGLLLYLRKNLGKTDFSGFKNSFAFLYRDYKMESYFWGFLIFLMKLLLILFINLLSLDLLRQALVIIFLLSIFQFWEIKNQPYFNEELNKYASFSLNVLISTIFLKLFATVINDDVFDLMTTIMIIALNCCLYWMFLFKIFILKKDKIIKIASFLMPFSISKRGKKEQKKTKTQQNLNRIHYNGKKEPKI